MRRLIRFSAIAIGVFSVIIGCIHFAARLQPPPTTIQQLHLGECEDACLAGITLNQTTPEQARQRISQIYGPQGYVQRPISIAGDTNFFVWDKQSDVAASTLSVIFNKGVAASVGIGSNSLDKSMPTLGDILNATGPPTCLYATSQSTILVYETKGNILAIVLNDLKLTQPITSVTLTVQNQVICSLESTYPWRGITDYHVNN